MAIMMARMTDVAGGPAWGESLGSTAAMIKLDRSAPDDREYINIVSRTRQSVGPKCSVSQGSWFQQPRII